MSPTHTYQEKELISRLVAGEESAFSQVYRQFSATVFNTVMIYIKDINEVEELVQIIFIKLWEKRSTLINILSIKDYLFILARNTVFDHFKKMAVRERILTRLTAINHLPANIPSSADQLLDEKENNQLLEQAIQQLPSRQKQLYLLALDGELTYEEMAYQTQLSRLTVKKHLELARRFVRNYISKRLHFFINFF